MGLRYKQINRLRQKYRAEGASGLVSKRHGKPSNNRLTEEVKKEAMQIVQSHYKDFGPTLAHEEWRILFRSATVLKGSIRFQVRIDLEF